MLGTSFIKQHINVNMTFRRKTSADTKFIQADFILINTLLVTSNFIERSHFRIFTAGSQKGLSKTLMIII